VGLRSLRHPALVLAAAVLPTAVFSCRNKPVEPATETALRQACQTAFTQPASSAEPPAVTGQQAPDEQPASEGEEPLLLLEKPENAYEGPSADNSRCHVCHMNYQSEELAVTHARNFVSCEHCHGPSDAHCSDEGNITPPDRMFAEEDIVPFCMDCHPAAKIDIEPHAKLLAAPGSERPKCTSCHGEHVLNYRTCRWDKKTGKLL